VAYLNARFFLIVVLQLDEPNEVAEDPPAPPAAPLATYPAFVVPVAPAAALVTPVAWPLLPPTLGSAPPPPAVFSPAAAPAQVLQQTEAERQAVADEMANMFDFQHHVDAGDDEVSEMGDTTIREADTVVGRVESGLREVSLQEENERLRAENFMLLNNFPSATLLLPTGYEYALHNTTIEDGNESVQTNFLL